MSTYVIADIHGYYERLVSLLTNSGLIDSRLSWRGDDHILWLLGDFFDRGPEGLATMRLVRRLQREAPATGGRVNALLGNHEALLLGALKFGEYPTGGSGGSFMGDWEINGGKTDELTGLKREETAWLAHLPVMAKDDGTIFAHADSNFYMRYGHTIEEVNQAVQTLLEGDDPKAWSAFLVQFSGRRAFVRSRKALDAFLTCYGGKRLVHGHTPIWRMVNRSAESIDTAYEYQEGRCVNVDGGIYMGGPGVVYRFS